MGYIDTVGGQLKAVVQLEYEHFPLKAAPTLYVITISNPSDFTLFATQSDSLRAEGRSAALTLTSDRAVRAVYVRRELSKVSSEPPVYELILGYERRLEYTEWDPDSTDYGISQNIFSLENALAWFPERNNKFAIVSCADFAAIKPIMDYLDQNFSLKANLPDLSQEMLMRIAEGSHVRSATFSHISSSSTNDNIDAKTITVFDEDLPSRRIFNDMREEHGREQRSGFYSSHPDILRAGVGITRRFGRIWTPAHLSRDELVRLALGIIVKLEVELERVSNESLSELTGFYSNSSVLIGRVPLTGQPRRLFDRIIRHLIAADRNQMHRDQFRQVKWYIESEDEEVKEFVEDCMKGISSETLKELLEHSKRLGLHASMTYECENCGVRNVTCKECGALLEALTEDGQIICKCPSCKRATDLGNFQCDCSVSCPAIDPYSQLFVYPNEDLLAAIEAYFAVLYPPQRNPGLFVVVGNRLSLLSGPVNPGAREIRLEELGLWKTRAHLHTHSCGSVGRIGKILGKTKEKCPINNYHPSRNDCETCLQSFPSREQLANGQVCLLRLFGIPIGKEFDGIHHGHEGADINYDDQLDGRPITVGIHVKSKSGKYLAKDLRRTNFKVRELYTQIYYTLYKISQGEEDLDVLGIGIPNKISEDVLNSMKAILLRFGISFIYVDYDCWIKIVSLAEEHISFEVSPS